MKKEEFLKEVKNSNLCPNNFDKIYEEFNYFQDKAYETLIELHKVCEKNNIIYELAFGSLLGLVRDDGQIPWDYDIDVIVPFNERKKLVDALEKDLNKKFYYYAIENNKNCRHMIIRLAPKGFKSESLHVDVFFFCGTPNDKQERIKFCKRLRKISNIRFYKKVNILENSGKRIKRILFLTANKFICIFFNNNKLLKEYYYLCNKYDPFNSDIVACADGFATETQFESKYLWETIFMQDEKGYEFRIPKYYEKILTDQYGNYKELFPLSDRINEVLIHYNKLKSQNDIK